MGLSLPAWRVVIAALKRWLREMPGRPPLLTLAKTPGVVESIGVSGEDVGVEGIVKVTGDVDIEESGGE